MATSTTTTTEFIFFHLPDSVRVEDGNDREGKLVLEIFQRVTRQEGYLWSAWGRTEEDTNALVWVVGEFCIFALATRVHDLLIVGSNVTEWADDKETASVDDLRPLAKSGPELIKLRTRLTPLLSSVGGIMSAPIVDVTPLTFVSDETPEERLKTLATIEMMRSCVMEKVPDELRPSFYCLSNPDCCPVVTSPESPTGKAIAHVAVVGWQSTQQHHDVWKTDEFKQMIPKVRERLLPWPPGLGIKHMSFRMI